jgi:hypothetical protein
VRRMLVVALLLLTACTSTKNAATPSASGTSPPASQAATSAPPSTPASSGSTAPSSESTSAQSSDSAEIQQSAETQQSPVATVNGPALGTNFSGTFGNFRLSDRPTQTADFFPTTGDEVTVQGVAVNGDAFQLDDTSCLDTPIRGPVPAPGGQASLPGCDVTVSFMPEQAGTYTGQLVFTIGMSGGQYSFTLNLTGTADDADFELPPSPLPSSS